MLRHYLSVAALNFRKSPIVALANITVLALGLTAFVTTYAVTDFWNNAERQFSNSPRTYIISSRIEMKDGTIVLYEVPVTNPFLAAYLPSYFPQLQAISRARLLARDALVSAGGRAARLYVEAVDPGFLAIFDLPFVAGDPRAALAKPVTGVVRAISEPSHLARSAMAQLPFDVLASMDLRAPYLGMPENNGPENWFGIDSTTYMLLPANGSLTAADLDAGLNAIVASHMPAQQAAFGSLLVAFNESLHQKSPPLRLLKYRSQRVFTQPRPG